MKYRFSVVTLNMYKLYILFLQQHTVTIGVLGTAPGSHDDVAMATNISGFCISIFY